MIILCYGAMTLMGLLPLMGIASLLGLSEAAPLLLPAGWALAAGLVIGFVLSYAVGRALGLLEAGQIRTYEERREMAAPTARLTRRATPRRRTLPLRA